MVLTFFKWLLPIIKPYLQVIMTILKHLVPLSVRWNLFQGSLSPLKAFVKSFILTKPLWTDSYHFQVVIYLKYFKPSNLVKPLLIHFLTTQNLFQVYVIFSAIHSKVVLKTSISQTSLKCLLSLEKQPPKVVEGGQQISFNGFQDHIQCKYYNA